MKFYLVQHGEAKSKEEDPQRRLTAQGEEDVRRVAEFARQAGVAIAEIHHSGKRRAEQTAEILAEHLRPQRGLHAVPGLAPMLDVEPAAQALGSESASLMLVGHLPFLSKLASRLLAGVTYRPVICFKMGGIVCLERGDDGDWTVAWMVTPDILR